MAESSHDNNRPTPSKVRPRNSAACGGEIVAVQGGHIVRSTGRKDRHSKVCTAKGTRDRRVRLAAHTAIQFYDVQDRLGFDRPSKAVDWLIMKAQSAIDDLAQLPPWHPTAVSGQNPSFRQEEEAEQNNDSNPTAQSSTFFPAGASRNNTNDPDNNQDLRLSLHSFQDPIFLHHHSPASSRPPEFDRWPEHQQHPMELSRIQPWNGGYMFNPPPPVLGQNRSLFQREPLQSSNTPSVRAWIPIDHHYQSSFSGGFSEFQSDQVERYGYADNKPSFDSRH